MIFQRHEKEHETKANKRRTGTAACLKPILQISILTEEANKLGFTQKGATENYLCIFQVNWIFSATIKAKPKLNPLTTFSGTETRFKPFLD